MVSLKPAPPKSKSNTSAKTKPCVRSLKPLPIHLLGGLRWASLRADYFWDERGESFSILRCGDTQFSIFSPHQGHRLCLFFFLLCLSF